MERSWLGSILHVISGHRAVNIAADNADVSIGPFPLGSKSRQVGNLEVMVKVTKQLYQIPSKTSNGQLQFRVGFFKLCAKLHKVLCNTVLEMNYGYIRLRMTLCQVFVCVFENE